MTSLRDAAEEEALEAEAEYRGLVHLANGLFEKRDEIRDVLLQLGHLEDPAWVPTPELLEEARVALAADRGRPEGKWSRVAETNPELAGTIKWISRNGWPGMRDGRFIQPQPKEGTMPKKKTEGAQMIEVTERELYELRQGIKHREHELELAHEYMKAKGLSTAAPDERLAILRGEGPSSPGLMHRMGFVSSEIKAMPETEDPQQMELGEESDDG